MTLDESLGLIFFFFLLLKKLGLVLAWRTRAVLKNSPSPSEPRLCSCFLLVSACCFSVPSSSSMYPKEQQAFWEENNGGGIGIGWGSSIPLPCPSGTLHPVAPPRLVHACVAGSQFVPSSCRCERHRRTSGALVSVDSGIRYRCRASAGASMSKAAIAQLLPCKCSLSAEYTTTHFNDRYTPSMHF